MGQPAGPSLPDHFAVLEDPRRAAEVLHPLPEILLLPLCATLAGADGLAEVELWGDGHLPFLRRFLPCRHGIPSHRWPGGHRSDPRKGTRAGARGGTRRARRSRPSIPRCPRTASRAGSGPCAGPGPTRSPAAARPRAAPTPGGEGREPPHLVSAWAGRQRLALSREAVGGESNEITAIPPLLGRLAPDGALVTIDAVGAQAGIAATILRRGGDHLSALKQDRPATVADVEIFFADPPGTVETCTTTDGGHGRIEVRRHAVRHDAAWLLSDRRRPGEAASPGLATLGMVESTAEGGGETGRERRYHPGSARLDAATSACAVRAHWRIENRPHRVLHVQAA